MAGGGGQEKTEKATPKKRRDAREKEGNILQSKEVNTAVSLLVMFFALSLLGPFMYTQMQAAIRFFIEHSGDEMRVNQEFITWMGISIVRFAIVIMGPLFIIKIFASVIPSVIQSKGLFTMKPLKPRFSKLNPINGIKKLFSLQSFVNVIKGIIVIVAIVAIVYSRIMSLLPDIGKLPQMDLVQGVAFTARNIFSLVILIVILFAFVAAGDYIFQWWQYEKKLKMSKQEVKDEYKNIEGDPKIKSKIKQKQREIAQSRMMQEVPGADVVVRNPTHYAVALKYETVNTFSAPKVVAKGQDEIALKIIALAEEHGVPVTEDRPLAKALHDTVKLGSEIPHALFTAVATIFAELDTIKQKVNF
ncbi:MAG: flagellar biosynthesis protein FlhB [Oscillospiraceae bacterium]|nr:flagellar biosynthesis protein FlhB [Oscillospiraceae bacterium]